MENQMIYSGIEDMDIKSGGREMATVVYSNEEDGMCSFVIDGEEYVEDEERAIIPKAVLKQRRLGKEDFFEGQHYFLSLFKKNILW